MSSYLITGSSRGIGLDLVRLLASKPSTEVAVVFAAARTQTDALTKLVAQSYRRVHQVKMDVTDDRIIASAAATVEKVLAGRGLDVLVNNAGVMPFTPAAISTQSDLDSTFRTNVTSAHMVTSAFLPLLKRGTLKKVVNVSSTFGSIARASRFVRAAAPAYKFTKAALSMLTVQYAQSFAREGFIFMIISPGWVRTGLGGDNADLTPEQSATAVFDLISSATSAHNGRFYDIFVDGWGFYDGAEVPW
ncbi:short-chain dehydrogenase-like protein [Aspergillus uvarum CBS 121591]|uniref:Short-chain dehydrogenase-like protein n=1 Tax=Aspergillus uvarum CBS 121591 TaxID=1448315 RepID=A0A319C6M4_9EURO|nr:short-chain dehydrogenase-like protein [Aspergillus uvarum CBS 121591]PYH80975.1 short-chain dehydrogenase-like protein [Aspergillus uvarum CBS 121591]